MAGVCEFCQNEDVFAAPVICPICTSAVDAWSRMEPSEPPQSNDEE